MESVRSAQIQVDMWLKEQDIYSDEFFWQHKLTHAMTYDEPTVFHYLPPGFTIPEKPDPLPSDIDINTSSSSEDSLGEWQRRSGQRRGENDTRSLGKFKRMSIRSNVQTKKRNEMRQSVTMSGSRGSPVASLDGSRRKSISADEFLQRQMGLPSTGYSTPNRNDDQDFPAVRNPMLQSVLGAGGLLDQSSEDSSLATTTTTSNGSFLQLPQIAQATANLLKLANQTRTSPRPDDMSK
jgi:hypothetical protein